MALFARGSSRDPVKMASGRRTKPKMLSKSQIADISSSGKALNKEDLYERVRGEVKSSYKAFLDTCPREAAFVEEQKLPIVELLKKSSVVLFDLFSAKVGRSLDKCAMLQVKWYEHVREVLGSQEVKEIAQKMPSEVRDVLISVLSCYLESLWNVSANFIMEKQGNNRAVDLNSRITPEDTTSLIKLGSAALLSVKKRLKKVVNNDGKPAKGLKKAVVQEVLAIEKMEDVHKRSLPHFIQQLDEGNLFVLRSDFIPFLQTFSAIFCGIANQQGYNTFGRKLFKVSLKSSMFELFSRENEGVPLFSLAVLY